MIGRLMAKDPAARYQTAVEVAEVLGRHLAREQGGDIPTPDRIAPARRTGVGAAE